MSSLETVDSEVRRDSSMRRLVETSPGKAAKRLGNPDSSKSSGSTRLERPRKGEHGEVKVLDASKIKE